VRPPGGAATTMRTALSGYCCAVAPSVQQHNVTATNQPKVHLRQSKLPKITSTLPAWSGRRPFLIKTYGTVYFHKRDQTMSDINLKPAIFLLPADGHISPYNCLRPNKPLIYRPQKPG
jgi:hypothetical protein